MPSKPGPRDSKYARDKANRESRPPRPVVVLNNDRNNNVANIPDPSTAQAYDPSQTREKRREAKKAKARTEKKAKKVDKQKKKKEKGGDSKEKASGNTQATDGDYESSSDEEDYTNFTGASEYDGYWFSGPGGGSGGQGGGGGVAV
jgi:hypothetical protein